MQWGGVLVMCAIARGALLQPSLLLGAVSNEAEANKTLPSHLCSGAACCTRVGGSSIQPRIDLCLRTSQGAHRAVISRSAERKLGSLCFASRMSARRARQCRRIARTMHSLCSSMIFDGITSDTIRSASVVIWDASAGTVSGASADPAAVSIEAMAQCCATDTAQANVGARTCLRGRAWRNQSVGNCQSLTIRSQAGWQLL